MAYLDIPEATTPLDNLLVVHRFSNMDNSILDHTPEQQKFSYECIGYQCKRRVFRPRSQKIPEREITCQKDRNTNKSNEKRYKNLGANLKSRQYSNNSGAGIIWNEPYCGTIFTITSTKYYSLTSEK